MKSPKPIRHKNLKWVCPDMLKPYLHDEHIPKMFKYNFRKWIASSKLNTIAGLDTFNSTSITSGSVQIFDHFYLRHHKKRFRFLEGEYMYHKAVCKHGLEYSFLEDEVLNCGDAVIISVPYTRQGTQHEGLFNLLYNCNKLNVPVLLDFSHLPIAKNVNIDLTEHRCIETLAFSLSKLCHGAEHLRIGVRMQKENIDDGIDATNSLGMYARLDIGIANNLIKNYSIDYNWNTYSEVYSKYCKENNLDECNNILFGFENNERICIDYDKTHTH
jgi:hypothetical protein